MSVCHLCGYTGEANTTTKRSDLYVCLACYGRYYADKEGEVEKGNEMSWEAVMGKGGSESKRNPDVVFIAPNTAKLVHILLPDVEEPVSYWTHYIPNKTTNGPKGRVVICPGRDTCPACASAIYRTKRVHAMNVWDYEAKAVKILEGGNTIFQPLKQVKDQLGTLGKVDFSIKKIVSNNETSYSVVAIPMMSPFDTEQTHGLFPIVNLRIPNTVAEINKIIGDMSGAVITQVGAPITSTRILSGPAVGLPPTQSSPSIPLLQFGKYKGRTVEDVYKEDPNYIRWCSENISDPSVKAEAKRVLETQKEIKSAESKSPPVVSTQTQQQMLINEINEILQMDERYKNNYQLIIEKMKTASVDIVHPNGSTILTEFSLGQLELLKDSIK